MVQSAIAYIKEHVPDKRLEFTNRYYNFYVYQNSIIVIVDHVYLL